LPVERLVAERFVAERLLLDPPEDTARPPVAALSPPFRRVESVPETFLLAVTRLLAVVRLLPDRGPDLLVAMRCVFARSMPSTPAAALF
jgi:hypothetical protein